MKITRFCIYKAYPEIGDTLIADFLELTDAKEYFNFLKKQIKRKFHGYKLIKRIENTETYRFSFEELAYVTADVMPEGNNTLIFSPSSAPPSA